MGVIVKVGCVPSQSSMKVHSTTVQRTVVGRIASSTWMSRGGWSATIGKRSCPPLRPEPVTGLHQAASASWRGDASNTVSAGALIRTVVR